MRDLLRAILFVPETKPVSDLMRQMQHENTHMVVVVDEYGNTAGGISNDGGLARGHHRARSAMNTSPIAT